MIVELGMKFYPIVLNELFQYLSIVELPLEDTRKRSQYLSQYQHPEATTRRQIRNEEHNGTTYTRSETRIDLLVSNFCLDPIFISNQLRISRF